MPLQNRVSPFGTIEAASARGLFTGNRGIIHDPETKTLLKRRWSTKAWLICACDFRGRRREVMGRNSRLGTAGWTELFFLDEVTALAAGHRPCFFCRRERAVAFARFFAEGRGRERLAAFKMDSILHRERRASGRAATRLGPGELAGLPDGAMVERQGRAYALRERGLLPWDFSGYGAPESLDDCELILITPPSTLAALRRGYHPVWHPSAGS